MVLYSKRTVWLWKLAFIFFGIFFCIYLCVLFIILTRNPQIASLQLHNTHTFKKGSSFPCVRGGFSQIIVLNLWCEGFLLGFGRIHILISRPKRKTNDKSSFSWSKNSLNIFYGKIHNVLSTLCVYNI